MAYCQFWLRTYIILIVISAKKTRGESITCTNPNGCNWVCSANAKCDGNIYFCPSTSDYCDLTCISCTSVQIFSSADTFNINCVDGKGCDNMQITATTSASSINLQCGSRCKDISIHCPPDTLHHCKCADYVQNKICATEVSITPMIQHTTTRYPATSFIDVTDVSASDGTISSSYLPSLSPTELPSKYPTFAPQSISTAADVTIESSSSIVSTTRDRSAYEAEKIEITTTRYIPVFVEEYMVNNAQMDHVNVIVISGIISLALSVGAGFLYYLYKKTISKSAKNIFGFEADELENDTDPEMIPEMHHLPIKDEKKSVSSYIMTIVDKSDPDQTRGELEGVLVMRQPQTAGAAATNGAIMLAEESMTIETYDALYGPGTIRGLHDDLHPTLGAMETVELGNIDGIVHTDSN